jgi:transcriptional regulator with XRE-family HTH domain
MLSNLRTALAARNLRQVDLAIQTLKIPPSVLSEIIRGRRKASAELRRKIAEVLQADEVWLFKPVVKIPIRGRSADPLLSKIGPGCGTKQD